MARSLAEGFPMAKTFRPSKGLVGGRRWERNHTLSPGKGRSMLARVSERTLWRAGYHSE